MLRLVQELSDNANNLTEHLRFNEPSLKLAVEKMLRQVERAQHMLNEKGPEIISKVSSLKAGLHFLFCYVEKLK